MKVDTSLTLRLEGDDVACLRAMLRRLPSDIISSAGMPGGLPVPFLVGEKAVDQQELSMFANRLVRAVQGVS